MASPEDEQWLELRTGMEHVTRFNTELFRYLGQSATLGDHSVFNHIEISNYDDEGEFESMAIIFADNEEFEDLSRFMLRWNYPQHFNLAAVSPFVQYAFDATHGIDSEAENLTFPERWVAPSDDPDEDDEEDDGRGTE